MRSRSCQGLVRLSPPERTEQRYRACAFSPRVRQALLSLLEIGTSGLHGMREPIELFKFFARLIGSETSRTTYNSARREWRAALEQADRLHARYEHDVQDVEEIGKTIQIQRQRRLVEQILLQYRLLIDHARLRDAKKTHEQRQGELQRQTLDKQQAERELAALAQKLAGLHEEDATFQQRLAAWKTRRDQALGRYTAKVAELAGEQKLAEQLDTEIRELRQYAVAPLAEIEAHLERVQEEEAKQRQREFQVKQRAQSLREALRALEGGHMTFPEEVNAYLTLLRAQRIPFKLVADSVRIIDTRWLRAVEGVLGGERFTVLVEDADQRLQAKRLGS
jgi:chromosome segregation ATPase